MSEVGVSSIALSKVARVIKADEANKLCSKEAIFLISKTTEYFVGKLATNAVKGQSLKYDELAQLIVATPYYEFLTPIIPTKLTLQKAQQLKSNPAPPRNITTDINMDATPLAHLSKTATKALKFAPVGGGEIPAAKRRAKYKKRAGKEEEEEEDTVEEYSESEGGEVDQGDDDGEFKA